MKWPNEQTVYFDWVFSKYQEQLIHFLNTFEGRRLQGLLPMYDHLPVVRVSRNHVDFWTGRMKKGKLEVIGVYYTGNGMGVAMNLGIAVEKSMLSGKDFSIHSLRNYSGIYEDKFYPQVYLTVTNFTGGTFDDQFRMVLGASWSAARDAASCTSVSTGGTEATLASVKNGAEWEVWWQSLPTDTSSLGTGATISAARQFTHVVTAFSGGDTFDIVHTTIADVTIAVATSDFNKRVFTSHGSAACNTTNEDKFFTIDATGQTFINQTGYTKFGITSDRDVSNSAPTNLTYISSAAQANATSAYRPYLEVTYLAGSSGLQSKIW